MSYEGLEAKFGEGHNRRCIDGQITGCGKCVGYCQYTVHPGFLTERHRREHQCMEHGCHYYIAKPERSKPRKEVAPATRLLSLTSEFCGKLEGLRVLRALEEKNEWVLNYVTLTNEYKLEDIAMLITQQWGEKVRFRRLDLDYETCAELIFQ